MTIHVIVKIIVISAKANPLILVTFSFLYLLALKTMKMLKMIINTEHVIEI